LIIHDYRTDKAYEGPSKCPKEVSLTSIIDYTK